MLFAEFRDISFCILRMTLCENNFSNFANNIKRCEKTRNRYFNVTSDNTTYVTYYNILIT